VNSTTAAFGIAVLVLVIGCFLGWHANRTYAAHGDVKTTRGRIAGYRKTRLRSGLIAIAFVIIALLVIAAVVKH
jgi:ABC-type Fe3+ transport system permease subunit